jgi:multidrug efflux pump subunit AcrA (membrane-fusion protein)
MLDRRKTWLGEAIRIVVPLLILVAAIGGFMGLWSLRSPPPDVQRPEAFPDITTEALREHIGGFEIEVDGMVVPHRMVTLSAEVPGRITYKSPDCRAGRYVHAADAGSNVEPLIRIDSRDYEFEVQRLTAMLEQADVALAELDEDVRGTSELVKLAQRDVDLRRRELQRELSLSDVSSAAARERAEREELAARNAMVKLQNQYQLLLTRKESLNASKRLAQVQLEKARLDLLRTEIYAPTDGMIVEEMVEQDSFVQKGTSLLVLQDTQRAEVKCNLRLEQMYWLWLSDNSPAASAAMPDAEQDYELPRADVRVLYRLAGRDYAWDGYLARYDGIGLDERTRTIPCRVVVENPREVQVEGESELPLATGPPALLRGMFVSVRILIEPHPEPGKQLYRIPEGALRPGKRIWLDRDGALKIVPVEFIRLVKRAPANDIPVAAGGEDTTADALEHGLTLDESAQLDALVQLAVTDLRPGDRLIVSPLVDAREGMRLRSPTATGGEQEEVAP